MKRSILAPPARPSPSSSGREVRSACNSRLRSMKTGVSCAVWPLSPCLLAQFTQTDSIIYHPNWANVLAGLAEPQKDMDREAKLHTASAISWTEGPDCTARRLSGPRTLLRTIRLRRATKLLEALPDETPSQQLLVLPAAVPLDVPASAAENSSAQLSVM